MATVFRANGDGTYDLTHDGRSLDYDLEPHEFADAIRRARRRIPDPGKVYVEDESGYRTPLRGR